MAPRIEYFYQDDEIITVDTEGDVHVNIIPSAGNTVSGDGVKCLPKRFRIFNLIPNPQGDVYLDGSKPKSVRWNNILVDNLETTEKVINK